MRQATALLAWGALTSTPVAGFVKRSSADEPWKPAVKTAVVRSEVDQNQLEFGWSPRPTEAPELYGRYAGMMFERADDNTLGSDTCGFNGAGNSFTCITPGATCSFSDDYIGCCEPTSTCNIVKTTCLDYDASVAGDCNLPDDFHTLCCGTSARGACFTWFLSTADTSYTLLDCSAVSGTSTLLAYDPALGVPSSITEESPSTTDDDDGPLTVSVTGSVATSSEISSPKPKSKTPIGAIVGGAVGGVAVIALIGLAVFFILRKKKKTDATPPPPQQQLEVSQVQGAPPDQGQPPVSQIPPSPQSFAPTSPSGTGYPSGVPPSFVPTSPSNTGYPSGVPPSFQGYDPHMSTYGQSPYSAQSGYETYSPPPQQFHNQYSQQGFDQQNQYNQYGTLGFQPPSTASPPPNLTPSPGPKESEAIGGQHQQQSVPPPTHQHHQSHEAQELPAINPLGNESNRAELG
ncbi:hypothetical protein B0T10DRAFT_578321 [Thelonectria olida]|uniref:Uncharacterized protein n=1 Tax=Thelonectria olida TaxID=1576542 RepID=A0A9P8WIB7_9HYPO|nr:hypothetical protein B0T10DRAFT_578321 [Thelonectria olida]